MTDSKSIEIHNYCNKQNLRFYSGNPRTNNAKSFYENLEIDVLISINYLFIIVEDLIHLPKLIAFNVHGSLLPKYRGRTPHVWAIINNEIETGITAHIIDKGCDTGNILQQLKVPIMQDDTGFDMLKKFQENYFNIVSKVLEDIKLNKIISIPQDNSKATYFKKREPKDGRIDWNWQKERIRNWVRAQAFPYPGAFTYSDESQIIIDEVKFSDFGFDCDLPNGIVLSTDPVIIKTPNGALELKSIRENSEKIVLGKLLM